MARRAKTPKSGGDDRIGGYLTSALAFAGITGLWAWAVRGDEFYAMRELFGVDLPAATTTYLAGMPTLGFLLGRWRYDAPDSAGLLGGLGKLGARALNFTYSHLLIVLFTAAMASKAFLGWNLDSVVQNIDDSLFDLASRYAPWLAAYLGGFNLGRAMRLRGAPATLRTMPDRDAAGYEDGPQAREAVRDEPPVSPRRGRAHVQDEPVVSRRAAAEDRAPSFRRDPSFFPEETRAAVEGRNASRRTTGGRAARRSSHDDARAALEAEIGADGAEGFFRGRRAKGRGETRPDPQDDGSDLRRSGFRGAPDRDDRRDDDAPEGRRTTRFAPPSFDRLR